MTPYFQALAIRTGLAPGEREQSHPSGPVGDDWLPDGILDTVVVSADDSGSRVPPVPSARGAVVRRAESPLVSPMMEPETSGTGGSLPAPAVQDLVPTRTRVSVSGEPGAVRFSRGLAIAEGAAEPEQSQGILPGAMAGMDPDGATGAGETEMAAGEPLWSVERIVETFRLGEPVPPPELQDTAAVPPVARQATTRQDRAFEEREPDRPAPRAGSTGPQPMTVTATVREPLPAEPLRGAVTPETSQVRDYPAPVVSLHIGTISISVSEPLAPTPAPVAAPIPAHAASPVAAERANSLSRYYLRLS